MDLGKRMRRMRERRGLTLLEISKKIGKAEATVQRYESGEIKNLKLDTVEQIAEALKVSPAYLMGWIDESEGTKTRMIPIVGTIACGKPIIADENIEGYVEEVDFNLPSGELFYLKTKGDSMEPTIPENSHVLIRMQPDVEQNEIAAVLLNDDREVTLKRVKKQNDIMMLIADNHKYEPILITEKNPARIIGKVIKYSVYV